MIRLPRLWAAAMVATTGVQIVSYINALRQSAGIPAGIVENPAWSAGCAHHNHYEAINHRFGHGEDSSKPGFTEDGNFASLRAVLYGGETWTAGSNPFENAPGHMSQLLDPRLDAVGAAESEGYGCATTLASLNGQAPAQFVTYTYPPNGAKGWYYSATVRHELPFAPQEKVGIPQGTTTGPTLYVMFDGPGMEPHLSPGAKLTSATLTGPGGPVALAVVDNQTPGLAGELPTGGQLIPRQPLRPASTYTASVTGTAPVVDPASGLVSHLFAYTWSFTTGPSTATLRRQIRPRLGRRVTRGRVTLTVPPAAVGHAALLRFVRFGSPAREVVVAPLRHVNRVRVPFRHYLALGVGVTVQRFTAADGTRYPDASTSRTYR